MKRVNATEMKNRLGEVLRDARREPVAVTMYGRPSHVVLGYDAYQTLVRPEGAAYFHEIDDPETRLAAVDEWLDEVAAHGKPVDPGVVTNEDYYG